MKTLNKSSRFLGNEKARTQLLSAFVLALMVLTAFTGIFLMSAQVNAEHPSYTWDSETAVYAGDNALTCHSSVLKVNDSSYMLFYGINNGAIYVKERNTDANFTTSDSATQIIAGGGKENLASCVLTNGTPVLLYTDTSYNLYYAYKSGGTWSTEHSLLSGTADRDANHVVEFDGLFWYATIDETAHTVTVYNWSKSNFPSVSNSNTILSESWIIKDLTVDLAVYNNELYVLLADRTGKNFSYLKYDGSSWGSRTIVWDEVSTVKWSPTADVDPVNNTLVIWWQNGLASSGLEDFIYTTYDGSTWQNHTYWADSTHYHHAATCQYIDGYLYVYNVTDSETDLARTQVYVGVSGDSGSSLPSAPTGASATAYTNFDISLSGLDANSRIAFPTATVDDTTGDIVWANETSYGVLTVSNDGIQQINLSWVKGSGATNTVIRYATSDPGTWTLSTGTALYNDTGTSYNHQNLDAETHYYYALWSWNTSGYSETYVTCDAVAGNASVTNLTIHIEDVGAGTALVPKENFTLYGNASGSYVSLGSFDATTGNVTLTTSYAGLPLAIGNKLYFELKATVGAGAQPDGTYYDNNAQTLDCYVKATR